MPLIEDGLNEKTGLRGEEARKELRRIEIDENTSAAILDGFTYAIKGEDYTFRYDQHEQQNFSDMAVACLMHSSSSALLGSDARITKMTTVPWKATNKEGKRVKLELTPEEFLELYKNGALHHKETLREEGRKQKEEV